MAIPIINLSILNGDNGFRLDGEAASDESGRSVSNAGDINGDGFADVIVGAPGADPNGLNSGSSYVVFGKSAGFSTAMNLSSLDGSNGFRLDGTAGDELGKSVSNAGDVNGDGFGDLIVGAPGVGNYPGSSYVVFGKASAFSAEINLSSLDGNNGFRVDGGTSITLGYSVSGAGDINGDGFDDVIIGDGFRYGYVVFGKSSGFSATLNLSSLNGNNGFRLDHFPGISVSNAGDVNGDGYDDLIVGDPHAHHFFDGYGQTYYAGASYVVYGKASGFSATLDVRNSLDGSNGFSLTSAHLTDYAGKSVSSAGDVNGDGFDDVIIGSTGGHYTRSYVVFGKASAFSAEINLSSLDGNNGFLLNGAGHSVSGAGDFNGDGFDDLIVGSGYVVFGKAAGFSAQLDITDLNGNNGFRLNGVLNSDGAGFSVSGAGDINGDGFDDLIVGAPGADPNGASSGSSYVIFGGNFTGEAIYLGTPGDDNLVGTPLAERFEAGDGNDRMTGLGGADVFHGGAGDDTIAFQDLNFQLIDGGAGTDTLELTGNVNLTDFNDRINSIETIDLIGTLTLTLPDLLSLSDTTDTFTINGDPGAHVNGLQDGWADSGFDGNYHIYTNQGTTLRVDTSVSTDRPNTGVISLADLDGNNGFHLDGARGDSSGSSVSNAGDVNGDGFDDLLVDAPDAGPDGEGSGSGSSYVVFGKVSGFSAAMNLSSLDGSNGFRIDGVEDSAVWGSSVSNAGDVNGDGFDDLLVGAPGADSNGDYSGGASYVVFGKASGFDAAMNLSSLNGSNGFRLDGTARHDYSGISVSSAGDVNGDGFDDVIIGAPGADPNGNGFGSSYVVFGKVSGFSAAMNLSNLDGNNGFRLDGAAEYDFSGGSVSGAGDVNGDGFADVIVGAHSADPNGEHSASGSSYVVFGKAAGVDATLDLSSLDGNNGFRLDGVAVADESGYSVSSAGDVNGDGFDDLIIGAQGADPAGSSYVVFGKASGFSAAMNLSNLDGNNGFRLDGEENYDQSGRSVSTAGDINGDGFDDLIIGAPSADPNGVSDAGSSYVVFGKASGFDAIVNLSRIIDNNGLRIEGESNFDNSGTSVSTAGDVNGDGFDDLIIGAPNADHPYGSNDAGSSYVVFGSSDFGGGNVIAGTAGDDNLTGTVAAEIFEGGDGNDRMIGRGGADVFHGGTGDDIIRVSDLSFKLVDGGSGNKDVLSLGGGGNLNLDLADARGKISGIEIIYLHGGSGDKTLTLNAADVLNLSDTSNTLKINGDEDDRVVLQGDWTDGGIQGGFHTYTSDAAASPEAAVLLVGINLTADFA